MDGFIEDEDSTCLFLKEGTDTRRCFSSFVGMWFDFFPLVCGDEVS
jgi:hypothetical protein